MTTPVIPVDARRGDWPRLVSAAVQQVGARVTALEGGSGGGSSTFILASEISGGSPSMTSSDTLSGGTP